MTFSTVHHTQIANAEVVTVRSDDPYLLHPFQTYLVSNGVCGRVSHFSTKVAALNHHDSLVAAMTKKREPSG